MKNIVTIVLLFLLAFPASSANGNTLGWKTYLSYNNTNCVEESADQVFVVAEGALYTYGKEDNGIKQYYKGNGLNDTDIQFIVIKNLPYLYTTTSIRGKEVNSVMIHNEYAYLSIKSGIVVVDMEKKEITDTYNLSMNITSCAILNNRIYASTTEPARILHASLKDNLLDKTNWKSYTIPGFPVDNSVDKVILFNNQLFYLSKNKGVYYESGGTTATLVSNASMNNMKVIGDKLACIANSRVYLFTNTKTFDQINNLTIKDISTYQTNT